jgi:hypothetical protein
MARTRRRLVRTMPPEQARPSRETAPLHAISATALLVKEGNDFVVMADTAAKVAFSNGVSGLLGPVTLPSVARLSLPDLAR